MFGLEDQKKKKVADFSFELETELKNSVYYRNLKTKIEERVGEIRNTLRKGEEKEVLDSLGGVLQGYLAVLKVMSRLTPRA